MTDPDGTEREVTVNPKYFTLRKTLEINYTLPGSPLRARVYCRVAARCVGSCGRSGGTGLRPVESYRCSRRRPVSRPTF